MPFSVYGLGRRLSSLVTQYKPAFVWTPDRPDYVGKVVPTLTGAASYGVDGLRGGKRVLLAVANEYTASGASVPSVDLFSGSEATYVVYMSRYTVRAGNPYCNVLAGLPESLTGLGLNASNQMTYRYGPGTITHPLAVSAGAPLTVVFTIKQNGVRAMWVNGIENIFSDDSGGYGWGGPLLIGGLASQSSIGAAFALVGIFRASMPLGLCRVLAKDPFAVFENGFAEPANDFVWSAAAAASSFNASWNVAANSVIQPGALVA